MPGGGPTFRPDPRVLDKALEVAQSAKFLERARALGFSDDVIAQLPDRLRAYENVGSRLFGGFADDTRFIAGRFGTASMRERRLLHELGHVLDDIANPGLFARSRQAGFGWRGFYNAESTAYCMQSGHFRPLAAGFNATSQAYRLTTRIIVVGGFTYAIYEGHDEMLWLIGIGR